MKTMEVILEKLRFKKFMLVFFASLFCIHNFWKGAIKLCLEGDILTNEAVKPSKLLLALANILVPAAKRVQAYSTPWHILDGITVYS